MGRKTFHASGRAKINTISRNINILPDQAGLFGLATFWSLFILSGKKSLLCADTLWHIKVGQTILSTGEIVKQDIFSHTVAGKTWTAHEWLSEVIMAVLYNAGGFPGLSAFFFLLPSLTIFLLFKAAQSVSDEWSAFWATAVAAAMAQTHLLVRPHLITWCLGALFLLILMKQNKWLWILPLLTALWSNMHGGVLLGIVLQGAFLAGNLFDSVADRPVHYWRFYLNKNKRLLGVFCLSLIALGCNPFGYSLLLFPFHVSADIFSQHIAEWKAPDLREMWYVRYWLIFLGILIASYIKKSSWTWRLLLFFFIYQAMGHIRHVSIAAMFLAPWVAMALYDFKKKFIRGKKIGYDDIQLSHRSGPVLLLISFVIIFSVSTAKPDWWRSFTENRFKLPEVYSVGATSYLQKHGFPGERLLNEYNWGGYLIFTFDPPPKVFIDGRADMYGEKVFADFAKLTYAQPGFENILKSYRIDWILFPKDSYLIRYMQTKPEWQELYSDDEVAILALQE